METERCSGVSATMMVGDRHVTNCGCQTLEQARAWVEEQKRNCTVTFEIVQWEDTRTVLCRETVE